MKVPFGICQSALPGTHCVSGENYSKVSIWLSFLHTKEIRVQPVKPERERRRAAQVFLPVLLRWKNLDTPGPSLRYPKSLRAIFTGLSTVLGKDLSLCRGITVLLDRI